MEGIFGSMFVLEGISALIFALVLIFFGIILILLELVVPGGILGLIGGVAMVSGVWIAFESSEYGMAALLFAVLGAGLALILVFKYLPRSRLARSMILEERASAEEGYVAQTDRAEDWVGKVGVTVTMCRPAGIAAFKGDRVDVITEGTFIEEGQQVKVIAVDGNRMVVVPLEDIDQT